ncbi:MAG: cupin [Chloroflexota bacterium]|nr:cupin [Chloroflexota bacterium]MDQ3690263.1 cupin [Chloroflexota bacterium]
MATKTGVQLVRTADVDTWYRAGGAEMALGDVIDASNNAPDSMSVGFARYRAGASNPWTVTYDEALIIMSGRFSVRSGAEVTTAKAGEVIFLRAGTAVTYAADEDTALVYVTHPHWYAATLASEHAAQLDAFGEIDARTAASFVSGTP